MKIFMKIDKVAALMAGKDRHGCVMVEVSAAELTPEERDTLSRFTSGRDDHQKADFYLDSLGAPYHTLAKAYDEATPDTVRQLLAAIREVDAKIAAEKAEEAKKAAEKAEAEVQEYLKKSPEDLIYHDWKQWKLKRSGYYGGVEKDERMAHLLSEANRLIALRNEEDARQKAEEARLQREQEEREEREEREREVRIKAQVAAWVEQHGTRSQKDRHREGYLPLGEVKDAMRNAAFTPLDDFPRYEKLHAVDVCECGYGGEDHCKVTFAAEDSDELTETEYENVRAIRHRLPEAKVQPRIHVGTGSGCNNTVTRKSALVTVKVGEFDFSREYAI